MSHCFSEKAQKKKIVQEEVEQIAKEIQAGSADLKNDPVLRENVKLDNIAIVNYQVCFKWVSFFNWNYFIEILT